MGIDPITFWGLNVTKHVKRLAHGKNVGSIHYMELPLVPQVDTFLLGLLELKRHSRTIACGLWSLKDLGLSPSSATFSAAMLLNFSGLSFLICEMG